MHKNPKKKLFILIYSLAGGGAERVVSILLHELQNKFDITLVLLNNKIEYKIPSKQKIVYLNNSNPKESGLLKFLKIPFLAYNYKKICQQNQIDISLSFLNRPNYINTLAKKMGNPARTVISERIYTSEQYPSNSLTDQISRFMIKTLYPIADLIIPNSFGIKNDLEKNFSVHNTYKVIQNPFNIQQIKDQSEEHINKNFDKFTFITVGRLQPQKNHALLIRAFGKSNLDAHLVILGEGELKENLELLVNELSLNNKVFLLGFDANPYKYMSKADCFVLSSDYEGFPNVIVEALACGLPIISTDCNSGPREILAPSTPTDSKVIDKIELAEYGILTPVKNDNCLSQAMQKIIEDRSLLKSLKQNAASRAFDFSKEKIIAEFYNELNAI